jgi:hypothetical protein
MQFKTENCKVEHPFINSSNRFITGYSAQTLFDQQTIPGPFELDNTVTSFELYSSIQIHLNRYPLCDIN